MEEEGGTKMSCARARLDFMRARDACVGAAKPPAPPVGVEGRSYPEEEEGGGEGERCSKGREALRERRA